MKARLFFVLAVAAGYFWLLLPALSMLARIKGAH